MFDCYDTLITPDFKSLQVVFIPHPQLMKNWMEKNGVEIPEVESESLDTEVEYKVIMKLLMAGSNDF